MTGTSKQRINYGWVFTYPIQIIQISAITRVISLIKITHKVTWNIEHFLLGSKKYLHSDLGLT
jgi:hypothetical protein